MICEIWTPLEALRHSGAIPEHSSDLHHHIHFTLTWRRNLGVDPALTKGAGKGGGEEAIEVEEQEAAAAITKSEEEISTGDQKVR